MGKDGMYRDIGIGGEEKRGDLSFPKITGFLS
jgi:hypothetical protein